MVFRQAVNLEREDSPCLFLEVTTPHLPGLFLRDMLLWLVQSVYLETQEFCISCSKQLFFLSGLHVVKCTLKPKWTQFSDPYIFVQSQMTFCVLSANKSPSYLGLTVMLNAGFWTMATVMIQMTFCMYTHSSNLKSCVALNGRLWTVLSIMVYTYIGL